MGCGGDTENTNARLFINLVESQRRLDEKKGIFTHEYITLMFDVV